VGLGRSAVPTTPVGQYVRHDLSRPLPDGGTLGPVDAVVHCAALASPWAPPRAFVAANVDATRHVVQWCRANGYPHLVYVSSSSVLYRDADQFDLDENSPIPPDHEQINVYSRTKRIGERIVERYEGTSAVLRPRAVFGPDDTVLLPRILRAARRGVLPLLQRPGQPPVQCDLTYVDTAAHYVVEAVARRAEGIYGITNAEPVELYPFLLDLLSRLGVRPRLRRVSPDVASALAGTAERVSAVFLDHREPPITRFGVSVLSRSKTFDISRALRDLGAPSVSLADAVRRMVQHHGSAGSGT
jgi:nucleoside-diphosphate-sugar epimerase